MLVVHTQEREDNFSIQDPRPLGMVGPPHATVSTPPSLRDRVAGPLVVGMFWAPRCALAGDKGPSARLHILERPLSSGRVECPSLRLARPARRLMVD